MHNLLCLTGMPLEFPYVWSIFNSKPSLALNTMMISENACLKAPVEDAENLISQCVQDV